MNIEMTKLTSKGQVVIPQEIRDKENLKEGERFIVYVTDDSIVLKRVKNFEKIIDPKELENVFSKTWKIAKARGITENDVEEEIKNYRKSLR